MKDNNVVSDVRQHEGSFKYESSDINFEVIFVIQLSFEAGSV